MKHIILILAIILVCLPVSAKPLNVLAIHSYQQEFPKTKDEHKGFVAGLRSASGGAPLNIFTEYLNAKTSVTALEDTKAVDRYMQSKYLLNKPDIIFAANDEAIEYLNNTSLGYLKNIPLVFAGVTSPPEMKREGNVTGIIEHHDIKRFIGIIDRIFPARPEIVFIDSGGRSTDMVKKQIDRYKKSSADGQKIDFVIDMDIDKLLAKVPGDSSTVYVVVNAGGFRSESRHETLLNCLQKLSKKLPSKYIFNLNHLEIKYGLLGGLVTSSYDEGFRAGQSAMEIMDGTPPRNPVSVSANMLVFDRQALDRAGVKLPQNIAANAEFINNYPTFIEKHGQAMIALIIMLLMVIVITSASFSLFIFSQHKKLKEASRKYVEASRKSKQYMDAVDASNLVSIADETGRIKYINDQYLMISGYTRQELMGRSHRVLNHSAMDSKLYRALVKTVTKGRIWYGILLNKTKSGDALYLETSIVPIKDADGKITEYLSIRKDITQVIRQQREIKNQYTDILTGLPNRVKLLIDRDKTATPTLAILNIDGFNVINTYYGLNAGDHLLKRFAEILTKLILDNMKVYRLSGDEFAILAVNVNDYGTFNNFIIKIMEELSSSSFTYDGNELHLSVTSGTCQGGGTIITKAGMALRHAKINKRNIMTYEEVESEMEKLRDSVRFSGSLRNALANRKVIPYFQPVADSVNGSIVKYEALMRVETENGDILQPNTFMYLAKQLKLYNAMSMMMMEKTLEITKKTGQSICLNFDIDDILNPKFLTRFFELVEEYKLQGKITIEITESEGIDNLDELAAFVTRAKSNGCMVAIDDFGTGYSNFMYILSLQPDYLKIDGSITRQINVSTRARLLASTITAMCGRAGIKTIAEYVATEDIYESIQQVGIDYCQGYLFGRPSPDFRN